MFNPSEFLAFVQKDVTKVNKWQKRMREYLRSTDFYGWLFNPSKDQITDYAGIITAVYGGICSSKKKIEYICDIIEECPQKFGRSTATFLFSVVNYAVDEINTGYKIIDRQYAEGQIDKRTAKEKQEITRKYAEEVERLNEALLSIIKKDAKRLANDTGLPKNITKMALKQVPDPCFINNPKVGVYLNNILSAIYASIDHKEIDLEDVDWEKFFNTLFGKESKYDVASFILLETPKHVESFTSKRVRKIWDSLTAYALSTLDSADFNSMTHTIEIYLKRLARAIENSETEVRVDLRSISESEYPNLYKTVKKYRDKFDDLFRPLNVASLIE